MRVESESNQANHDVFKISFSLPGGNMKFLKLLLTITCIILFTGCSSRGVPFQQVQAPEPGNAVVYLMRGSSFVSSLNCPDVKLNDEYVACLKQNGFIRIEMKAGENKICFCRSALEIGEDTVLTMTLLEGDVKFFEWKPEIGDMVFVNASVYATGGKMESIIEHNKETAIQLLTELKDSV